MKNYFRYLSVLLAVLMVFTLAAPAGMTAQAAGSTLEGHMIRLSGDDRFATSATIAGECFSGSKTVFIASGKSYADALAGVPLAYAMDAPILLVDGEKIAPSVEQRISDMSPSDICILGGTAAVGKAIENKLAEQYSVSRIAGSDRYDTCLRIAERLTELAGAPKRIFAVYGGNYPDALSCGCVAAVMGCPILYVTGNNTYAGFDAFVSSSDCSAVTVLGGTKAVSEALYERLYSIGLTDRERLSGSNRYQTSLETAKRYSSILRGGGAVIATGEDFPDALAGGVLAAKVGKPIVLVNNTSTVDGLHRFLKTRGNGSLYILGGRSAVSDYTMNCLKSDTKMTTTTTVSPKGKNNQYVKNPNYTSKYYMVVYQNSQTVTVYGKDSNGKYNVNVRTMKCSTGLPETPTPNGMFDIQYKYRWRLMMGDVYAQYACRFAKNLLFHSVIYSKQDPSTLFSNSYRNLGRKASHGCVRLCVRDAKWVYDNVPVGTQVRIVNAKGPAGLPIPSLKSGSKYSGWEPSDPNSRSPYNK